MKKLLGLVVGILLLAPLLATPLDSAKANYNIDNRCNFQDDTLYENVNGGGGYYQTFTPKENRITSAVLMLGAFQTDSTATLKIMDSGSSTLATQAITVSGGNPVVPAPFSFDNFSPITVTPGHVYKLALVRSAGNTLYWYKTTTCDISGNAYADGASLPAADYVFTTYGYTESSPAPTPTPSTQIAAPTKTAATYQASTKQVKLTWDKSTTTDIEGYNIYRSEDASQSFTKLGQVGGSVTEYQDTTIIAKKTYYYYVKTYKSSNESAQSNTASVTIPNNLTAATANTTANLTNWFFYLLFGGVALALIIFLIVYELKLKKKWAEQAKNGKKLF